MTIQITHASKTPNGTYFQATIGKTSADVAMWKHGLQVCNHNASHRVWRGLGKLHRTVDEALAHYKTPAMKAIIAAAVDFHTTTPTP